MNEKLEIKGASKGEKNLLNLLLYCEEQFNPEEDIEIKKTFYIGYTKYDINIKSTKLSNSIIGERENISSEDSEIAIEIIKDNKDKITFKKELTSGLNGLIIKERVLIIEKLEQTIIKELTRESGYNLSFPFIEFENKINIADTITNNKFYKKSKEGLEKFAKSIFNPELKDRAREYLEQRGIDTKTVAENLKEKLEVSTPKTKLYFSTDGRQYLNHKNEWYIKTDNEISYNNYLYDLSTKEFYENREDSKISFTTLEKELNKSEKNLNKAKSHLKNANTKDTSAIVMEKKIKEKRNQIQKVREKLEFVATNFFKPIKNITKFSELELLNISEKVAECLAEEKMKNYNDEVFEMFFGGLTDETKGFIKRLLKKNS